MDPRMDQASEDRLKALEKEQDLQFLRKQKSKLKELIEKPNKTDEDLLEVSRLRIHIKNIRMYVVDPDEA